MPRVAPLVGSDLAALRLGSCKVFGESSKLIYDPSFMFSSSFGIWHSKLCFSRFPCFHLYYLFCYLHIHLLGNFVTHNISLFLFLRLAFLAKSVAVLSPISFPDRLHYRLGTYKDDFPKLIFSKVCSVDFMYSLHLNLFFFC